MPWHIQEQLVSWSEWLGSRSRIQAAELSFLRRVAGHPWIWMDGQWDFQCVSVSDPQTDATLQGHTSAAVLKSITELTGLLKKKKKLLIGAGNWTQERDRESRWEMMSWLFTTLFSFLSRLWRRVSLCALSHISDHPEHPYGDVMKEKTLDPCPLPPKPSSCPHSASPVHPPEVQRWMPLHGERGREASPWSWP